MLAAPGAERASGVWVERWSLLDIFLVLIITVAAWRLLGPLPGAIALLALVIAFHEPEAPRWAWLNLLVAVALLRVAPAGRFQTWCTRYKWASFAALAVLLIPFAVGQLRMALHPQLERFVLDRGIATAAPLGAADLSAVQFSVASPEGLLKSRTDTIDEIAVTGVRKIGGELARYQPGALVQVGPGLPDREWNRYMSFRTGRRNRSPATAPAMGRRRVARRERGARARAAVRGRGGRCAFAGLLRGTAPRRRSRWSRSRGERGRSASAYRLPSPQFIDSSSSAHEGPPSSRVCGDQLGERHGLRRHARGRPRARVAGAGGGADAEHAARLAADGDHRRRHGHGVVSRCSANRLAPLPAGCTGALRGSLAAMG